MVERTIRSLESGMSVGEVARASNLPRDFIEQIAVFARERGRLDFVSLSADSGCGPVHARPIPIRSSVQAARSRHLPRSEAIRLWPISRQLYAMQSAANKAFLGMRLTNASHREPHAYSPCVCIAQAHAYSDGLNRRDPAPPPRYYYEHYD